MNPRRELFLRNNNFHRVELISKIKKEETLTFAKIFIIKNNTFEENDIFR